MRELCRGLEIVHRSDVVFKQAEVYSAFNGSLLNEA